MKKRYIVLFVIAAAAVALCAWLFLRPQALGEMDRAYSQPETSVSSITFSGVAGDRIRFSFSSTVKSGNVEITVRDSKGNEVEGWEKAKKLVTYLTLDRSDTYTVEADCRGFTGEFRCALYKG